MVQSFSLLAGDFPWPAWVHQLPCLLLHPLPFLLGPKEFGGETASYKAGSPTTSSLSRALFPSPDARDHVAPRATRSQLPRAQRKELPRPDHPAPRPPKAPAAASGTRPTTAGVSQPPAGSHQKNSREQKFASCIGLGFRILPAGAASGRGRAALVMELLLEAPAGRLAAQTQRRPLKETEPLALGVDHRGPPAARLCLWAWSRERWGQDHGAARRTLPGAAQV